MRGYVCLCSPSVLSFSCSFIIIIVQHVFPFLHVSRFLYFTFLAPFLDLSESGSSETCQTDTSTNNGQGSGLSQDSLRETRRSKGPFFVETECG